MLVKIHWPRFARISVLETENVEVLNDALFMTQNVAEASQPITSQERSFPLVVPPKPEPFIE